MEENYKLSHLRELEAESIHIIREVAAEFENPVMLYGVKEPTVPKGTARFRIGLNPQLSKEDILRFVKELKYEIDTVF